MQQYTTNQLITNAYYLSGVVSRTLQSVTGDQISDGLNLLNDLLGVKSANTQLIPYFQEYDFTLVTNQETYVIPNLLAIETFVFFINSVRYATFESTRKNYQGSGRIENVSSLPFNWYLERGLNQSTLFLYFFPAGNYSAKIWGKFGLSQATLGQNLATVYDRYYIVYLRYALAEYICTEYNIEFQPQNYKKLRQLENVITYISPPDLTLSKISALQSDPALSWGDINLGHGWRPGG
jgi:hypothetical protein